MSGNGSLARVSVSEDLVELVRSWIGDGHSLRELAEASGVGRKTLERVKVGNRVSAQTAAAVERVVAPAEVARASALPSGAGSVVVETAAGNVEVQVAAGQRVVVRLDATGLHVATV